MNDPSHPADKKIFHLRDYRPPAYLIPTVELTVTLHPKETRVQAKLHLKKNPNTKITAEESELFLNGEDLDLKKIQIDGRDTEDYRLEKEGIVLLHPKPSFTLETEVVIHPHANTRLEGLYLSGEILCTQCEAEGFRRIAYFLDRPDVLSVFTVTLIADSTLYPTLLSNGNRDPKRSGREPDGKIREVFLDPFPKPAYLFAIVAGKMDELLDTFTTLSGRQVNLAIYSEPGKIDKCGFAMESLKAAMKWEEEVYGLEYDLDDYKIVAVDAFNLGAMENKGLNLFNSAAVFYDARTATDADRERVACTIAHEYFHNWTGNRVTIRDWFQLTLKEGLTVYRDRCFSADHGSPTVERIRNANLLRSLQFPEDSGPLAHPIQPDSYESINNFYTLTVYEKGAEVVGMYETLLGKKKFIHGVKQYLHAFDGQAATVEDFFNSMQSMSPQDLSQFMNWYHTPGTPTIEVETTYHPEEKTYRVRLTQLTRKPDAPLLIPLQFSVNLKREDQRGDRKGDWIRPAHYGLWKMEKKVEERIFTDIESPPRLSLNENFSAPVKVVRDFPLSEWIEQFHYEQNPFLKWEAIQQCYLSLFRERTAKPSMSMEEPIRQLVEAMEPVWKPILTAFRDTKTAHHFLKYGYIDNRHYGDCSFLAELLTFPGFQELMETVAVVDFETIRAFMKDFRNQFVFQARDLLEKIYTTLAETHIQGVPFTAYPGSGKDLIPGKRNLAGERKLKNTCLGWLMEVEIDRSKTQELAREQWRWAQETSNFNDELMALRCLLLKPNPAGEEASQAFYERWRKDNLVINHWLRMQAEVEEESTLKKIVDLQGLPEFSLYEPNKCRALFRNFIRNNPLIFNHPSGEGYRIIADVIIRLDAINPISASDLLTNWPDLKKMGKPQKEPMRNEMKRIHQSNPSRDVLEIVEKRLDRE